MADINSEPVTIPDLYSLLYLNYPDVVSVEQVCEMLGDISSKTAYKLLQAGRIDHFRIGRTYKIPKQSVIHYLREIMNTCPLSNNDALTH
ncbi:helix-turn-helix domain-containing protein [Paenibacillus faecis]|uniref:Helix-turn-helix domain-containing protein n=1 Tax=Paenibacillus faecis TaxID=862114 RepID=A0A5D0CXQ2_9BACL|nr:helix-turn-helix domain-containing protein [Paenibacillus faecis]TYA14802.1 helix-turn-helix domain-containing protein [Paenibacillus faecis]